MSMSDEVESRRSPTSEAEMNAHTIGGASRHGAPISLVEYDTMWPILFEREATRIMRILGATVERIEHVGSTSVPRLAAKPIIDIVMAVADSSDEVGYVIPLEANGYRLRIRETTWWQHRLLKGPDTDVNLHVFTAKCPEVERMLCFRNQLRRCLVWRQPVTSETRRLRSADRSVRLARSGAGLPRRVVVQFELYHYPSEMVMYLLGGMM